MSIIKPEDLEKIRENMAKTMSLRGGQARARITVHMGTCGIASGSRKILKSFIDQKDASGATDVIISTSGCAGLCSHEPMATVELIGEAPVKYIDLTEEKVDEIYKGHVMEGKIVTEYALAVGSERVS